MHACRHTSYAESLRVLGLGPGATRTQIKRAYRRLALQYHPDRHRASSASSGRPPPCVVMFHRVTSAYALLEDCSDGRPAAALERCARCHDPEPLLPGLDGNRYCRTCLLHAEGKRSLPAPPPVVVGCSATAAGLVVSVAWLAAWSVTGWAAYWWMSVGTCLTAMAFMVAVCLTVRHAAHHFGFVANRHAGVLRRAVRRLFG